MCLIAVKADLEDKTKERRLMFRDILDAFHLLDEISKPHTSQTTPLYRIRRCSMQLISRRHNKFFEISFGLLRNYVNQLLSGGLNRSILWDYRSWGRIFQKVQPKTTLDLQRIPATNFFKKEIKMIRTIKQNFHDR